MSEELQAYTVRKAASLLTLSERSVYRLVAAGTLDAKRAGRRIIIPASALRQYVMGNR